MRARLGVGVVVALIMVLVGAQAASAMVKTVSFDDLPVGTSVGTQYADSAGVTFRGQNSDVGYFPVIRSAPGQARSGTQVADFATCVGLCGEFPAASARGRLSQSASQISVAIGYLGSDPANTAPVTLTAYDAAGHQIDVEDATVTQGAPFITMTVTSATPNIAYFDLYSSLDYTLAMDDLSITYPDTPQPPDFAVSSESGVAEVLEGTSSSVGIDLSRLNGSAGDVTFGVSGLPAGMTATFAPNPIGGADTHTTLTLTAPTGAPATDDYSTVTVTATPAGPAIGPAARSATFLTRIKANCERTISFTYVDARTDGCFHKFGDGLHQHEIVNTEVRINGLVFTPLDGARDLVIDDDKKTITSPGSTFAVAIDSSPADIPVYTGTLDMSFAGSGTGPRDVTGLGVSANQGLKVAGLPITGMTVQFTSAAKTVVTPTFKLDFWPFNYLGAITTSAALTTGNDHGADFSSFDLKIPKLEALALTLTDVSLHYENSGTWSGSVKATLNFAKKLTIGAGIRFSGTDR